MLSNLLDGQAMHQAHPETFEVPSSAELVDIKPSDFVKLGFKTNRMQGPVYERMWVRVTSTGCGVLDNEPAVLGYLKRGDHVEYEPRHVLAILKGKGAH